MIKLLATARNQFGKGIAKKLRVKGEIPAVIYGPSKPNLHIRLEQKDIWHLQEKSGLLDPMVVQITSDDQTEAARQEVLVRIKALQRHPYKPCLLHVDFVYMD